MAVKRRKKRTRKNVITEAFAWKRYLTVKEACVYTGRSPATFTHWIRRGKVEYKRTGPNGGRYLIRKRSIKGLTVS